MLVVECCLVLLVPSSMFQPIIYAYHKVDGKRKRGESRAKAKPDQTAVPEEVNMKKVNYRSNITRFVKLLKDTKFTSGQLKCLRKTSFWPLFDCLITNEIDLNNCMKYDDVSVRIVQTFK